MCPSAVCFVFWMCLKCGSKLRRNKVSSLKRTINYANNFWHHAQTKSVSLLFRNIQWSISGRKKNKNKTKTSKHFISDVCTETNGANNPRCFSKRPELQTASPLWEADYCRSPVSKVLRWQSILTLCLLTMYFSERFQFLSISGRFSWDSGRFFLPLHLLAVCLGMSVLDLGMNIFLNDWQHSRAPRSVAIGRLS